MVLIFGYAGFNTTLKEKGIIVNRTCMEITAREKGAIYLLYLLNRNLLGIIETIKWNHENNIRFYRMSSDFAPHITNPNLILEKDRNDFTKLAYSIESIVPTLEYLGKKIKEYNIRVTFHPDLFNVLNSDKPEVVIRTYRDLYFHTLILDTMKLSNDSVIVLHGGGVYGNKPKYMQKWVENYEKLPENIRNRVVLENDETSYSIEDVLEINKKTQVPIVFDVFHHYCHDLYSKNKNIKYNPISITQALNKCLKTWKNRHMKIHISEQSDMNTFGAHSDYVKTIPEEILEFSKNHDLYVMVEAKKKELAALFLMKKYKNYL